MKFCRDCGTERPLEDFTRNRNSRDGHAFYCRDHARQRHQVSRDRRKGKPDRRHPRDLVVPAGYKWCPDCDEVKPLDAFGSNAAAPSGVTTYCKPCHNARGKASKEKVGGARSYHLRRRYGITAADADAMLEAQGGLCAICRSAPAAHVDHDHVTGAVRALLCFGCNGGLGQFGDDPERLRAAADYVERHRDQGPRSASPASRCRRTVSGRVGCPPVGSGWRVVRVAAAPRETYVERARVACLAALREADG